MNTIKVVCIGVQSGSSCFAVINVQFVVHRCEEKQRFTVVGDTNYKIKWWVV